MISNEILKKLPPNAKEKMTDIFNKILEKRKIPEQWKEYTTILIPKPNNKGFRPIALAPNTLKFNVTSRKRSKLTQSMAAKKKSKHSSTQVKFLGVLFDSKLNWTARINNIKSRALNTLNIIKAFSNKKWGHSQDLSWTGDTGLKICLMTLNICKEHTLTHRRNMLIDRYLYKISSLKSHLLILKLEELSQIIQKRKNTHSCKLMKTTLSRYNTIKKNFSNIFQTTLPIYYEFPLISQQQNIKYSNLLKNTQNHLILNYDQMILKRDSEHNRFYVDESAIEQAHGCSIYHDNTNFIAKYKITGLSTSMESEIYAILVALRFIKTNKLNNNTQKKLLTKSQGQQTIKILVWVPSHTQITGNVIADREVKRALNMSNPINLKTPIHVAQPTYTRTGKEGSKYLHKISFTHPNKLWTITTHLTKAKLTIYLRVLTNSHCTPETLFKFNMINHTECTCGWGHCYLNHLIWDGNQHIVLRKEFIEKLFKYDMYPPHNTNAILASMNFDFIDSFCEFLLKSGIRE
ncbi:hypothetical protein TSAR_001698 [Trichomalopsis sarcophagae]|uniref:RNase H type-1 domain-containing protein n=1 Tax=Trichomalopsis sarcophagae TaxID=543379 RepID=A0A232EMY4_9HYME|nr:hypothetical protein TSAR_001698 [Trichomalopsis sarcophagae]